MPNIARKDLHFIPNDTFFFDDIIVKIKNIIMVLSLKQVSCVRIAVPYRFIGQVNVEWVTFTSFQIKPSMKHCIFP